MATIQLRLSSKVGSDGKSQVIVKLTINRTSRPCFKSGVFVNPDLFKPIQETKKGWVMGIVAPKKGRFNAIDVKEANEAKTKLDSFIARLTTICNVLETHGDDVNHETIVEAMSVSMDIPVDSINYNTIKEAKAKGNKNLPKKDMSFFDWYRLFYEKHGKGLSTGRLKRLAVVGRMLARYEAFVQLYDSKRKNFKLDINTIDKETLEDFFDYLVNEKSLLEEYPSIFKKVLLVNPFEDKVSHQVIKERGDNVMVIIKKVIISFYNWLNSEEYTTYHPFRKFKIESGKEKYGTPYFLKLDERNIIADFDLDSKWEELTKEDKHNLSLQSPLSTIKTQRDIFMFQCLIGCRVSDLMRMTPTNIVNGAIEYIPRKTKDKSPKVVHVPLNKRALALVEKYHGIDKKGRLFPFISNQKYNDAIKDLLKVCGINRPVTILNPVTKESEQIPICDVASSHMARRTFIGNLYKQVKDPNLVGCLSGHIEGSKAFARYRDIDEEMKKDLVSLID